MRSFSPTGPANPLGAPVALITTSSGASSTQLQPSRRLSLIVVQLPVAAQQHRHRLALVGLDDQGLDQALGGNLQKEGHLLDRFAGRGQHLFELLRGSRRRDRGGFDFRLLHIGRVLAAVAGDDGVLARFGQHHEFMGVGAADGTGLGLDGAVLEAAALEDTPVGLVHLLVGAVRPRLVQVEGVGVLHDEFAAAHQAETGPDFVAEFSLDLVEIEGQLPVGADLPADDVGDHFLVGRPHAELGLLAVLEPQQLLAVIVPAPGFLPQLGRHHRRHEQFDGARARHLFADDVLHLADGAQPEGQVAVDAGGDLADHAGPQHELVTDHLGIGGGFLEGGEQILGVAHGQTSGIGFYFRTETAICAQPSLDPDNWIIGADSGQKLPYFKQESKKTRRFPRHVPLTLIVTVQDNKQKRYKTKPAGRVPPDAFLFVQAATKRKQKVPLPCGGHCCRLVLVVPVNDGSKDDDGASWHLHVSGAVPWLTTSG